MKLSLKINFFIKKKKKKGYTSFIFFFFLNIYFDSSSPYFILYKFNIISSIQSIFSPTKNSEYCLSLSLSLSLSNLKHNTYCCYTPIEPHQQPHHSLLFYLFFSLFLTFIIHILNNKKIKKFLLPISPHLLLHFLQRFPSFFSLLISTLQLHFLHIFFSFLYFGSSSTYFIPYKFDIISLIQSIFSSHKTVSTLSRWFFFFLISLIKVDGFYLFIYFKICVLVFFFFLISHQKVFSFHFIVLVEF